MEVRCQGFKIEPIAVIVKGLDAYEIRGSILWPQFKIFDQLPKVVAKTFLIDLSKTETMALIVSFRDAGFLFLVVGYFSPIPLKKNLVRRSRIFPVF